ncbi:hypothetical protein C8F04DRAFT_1154981 [Mycena alexandri]|uniref:F-box domain-containing protein n=1 Tax=Mycena alexandri TaxID=1745969 RepID=A0AAD6WQZ7_9AGAR|nr:hypothetical protein C8F04DRAFT_1154981 [Mycena alexandri]
MSSTNLTKFVALPTELVDLVSSHTADNDLLALCRTNRRVYAVCLRWIYRKVLLPNACTTVSFFKAVISNKLAASYVLDLSMQFFLDGIFKAFSHLLRVGMSNLTRLYELSIMTPDLLGLVYDMHFPHLRECVVPLTESTTAFLRLHPKLANLVVSDHLSRGLELPTSLTTPRTVLPNLTTFMGPHTVAPWLLPGSPTTLASITYHCLTPNPYLPVLATLANSVPALRTLISTVPRWDPNLPAAIAGHLPTLSGIKIRHSRILHPDDESDLPSFLLSLDDMIRTLHDLTAMHITSTPQRPPEDRSSEFDHVRRWGDISPEFNVCLFPTGTKWVRLPTYNIWFPTESAGAVDWFIKEVLRSTSLPPAYIAALEELCGKDRITKLRRIVLTLALDALQ